MGSEMCIRDRKRVVLYFHPAAAQRYGVLKQSHSQDVDPHVNHYACRAVSAGEPAYFVSVLVPHSAADPAARIVAGITTRVDGKGNVVVSIGATHVIIEGSGNWTVKRAP